jgi:hypothetical protein
MGEVREGVVAYQVGHAATLKVHDLRRPRLVCNQPGRFAPADPQDFRYVGQASPVISKRLRSGPAVLVILVAGFPTGLSGFEQRRPVLASLATEVISDGRGVTAVALTCGVPGRLEFF